MRIAMGPPLILLVGELTDPLGRGEGSTIDDGPAALTKAEAVARQAVRAARNFMASGGICSGVCGLEWVTQTGTRKEEEEAH